MINKNKFYFTIGLVLLLTISFISATSLPTVGEEEDTWGTILNTFLNVSHNESGELRKGTVSSLQIVNETITDSDISNTINLTIGEKITFSFGEIIDNIVDGWIRVVGGLNISGNATANYFIGDGSLLTGVEGLWSNISGSAVYSRGNVGINVNNPRTILHINTGDAAEINGLTLEGNEPAVRLNSSDGNGNVWQIRAGTGGLNPLFRIYDETGSTDRLIIENGSGNIGIGTTTPSVKLEVDGSIKSSETFFFSDSSTQIHAATPEDFSWHIASASYVKAISISQQDPSALGLFFKSDGTKMYLVGDWNDAIYQYALSTPWDISTAATDKSRGVSSQDVSPSGIFFKPDGTKMYMAGSSGGEMNEYALSTPWDISTTSHTQVFSVATQEIHPRGVFFRPDGRKIYIVGTESDNVNEYTLSTPWDISTALHSQVFNISFQETSPQDISFKSDGKKMYIIGTDSSAISEYDLYTSWDISTASYTQVFSVATQEIYPRAVFFKPDGSKMYVIGTDSDNVSEYNLGLIIEGNVGIGTINPQVTLHLQNTGDTNVLRLEDSDGICNYNPESGSVSVLCSSDEKLKEDIHEADSVLDGFEKILVRDYIIKASGDETTGVIAQEIQETNPELVKDINGTLFVEQPNPWKLLKGIQELKRDFDILAEGNYSASSEKTFNKGSAGQVLVSAGLTSTRIKFNEAYTAEPIVVITPIGLPNFFYGVDNIDTTGFNIVISKTQDRDIIFNWHAFAQQSENIMNETMEIVNFVTNETIETNISKNKTSDMNITIPESNVSEGGLINNNESQNSSEENKNEEPAEETYNSPITGGVIRVNDNQENIFTKLAKIIGELFN